MTPKIGGQSPTSLVRPDHIWVDAAGTSPGSNADLAIKLQTYHTDTKDQIVPYPFATNPHMLITCRYSGSSKNHNELVFRHVYPSGHATTGELLHRYRTEAHVAIRKRLCVNMLYTDVMGDTVTVVTMKSEKH